jgi:hypothetical protein
LKKRQKPWLEKAARLIDVWNSVSIYLFESSDHSHTKQRAANTTSATYGDRDDTYIRGVGRTIDFICSDARRVARRAFSRDRVTGQPPDSIRIHHSRTPRASAASG